jgi:hypothetical protein
MLQNVAACRPAVRDAHHGLTIAVRQLTKCVTRERAASAATS